MAKAIKKAIKAAVAAPKEQSFNLSDPNIRLRLTCKRKVRKDTIPAPAEDNPEAAYEECGGVLDMPLIDRTNTREPKDYVNKRPQIFACPKCASEFSSGMKIAPQGDRIGVIANVLNSITGSWAALFKAELVKA